MAKTIIVGAGPLGLLTGILLHLKGVKDLEIIDPRAGIYLRPGHVNERIFYDVRNLIRQYLPSAERYRFTMTPSNCLHIKEMERMLYEKAQSLGIKITKDQFLRLLKKDDADDASLKGIVVISGETGLEAFISAEHVFDCTGGRREVCESYNTLVSSPPFIEEKVYPNVIIKTHLIYNMKVKNSDAHHLDYIYDDIYTILTNGSVEQMEKLRALGWTRAVFPTMYKKRFTRGIAFTKYCFYLEAPDGLQRSRYDEWFKACLNIYVSAKKIEIVDLKVSQKYGDAKDKVRKLAYLIEPTYLERYEGIAPTDVLPGVYPVGDSQTTPDSRLAHGIRDGQERVGALARHVIVNEKGELVSINLVAYRSSIRDNIQEHNNAIVEVQKSKRIGKEISQVSELITKYKQYLSAHKLTMTIDALKSMGQTIQLLETIEKYYALFKKGQGWSCVYDYEYPLTMLKAKEIVERLLKDGNLKQTLNVHHKLKEILGSLPQPFVEERAAIGKVIVALSIRAEADLSGLIARIDTATETETLAKLARPRQAPSQGKAYMQTFFQHKDAEQDNISAQSESQRLIAETITRQTSLFELIFISPIKEDMMIELIAIARQIVQLFLMTGDIDAAKRYGLHFLSMLSDQPTQHGSIVELKEDLMKLGGEFKLKVARGSVTTDEDVAQPSETRIVAFEEDVEMQPEADAGLVY